jgi:hypothetical protein
MTGYITNHGLSDGFGSQFQHIICCILIAYKMGHTFVYNPVTIMEHNYDNDPDFLEKMENLMNIKPYFMNIRDESLKNTHIEYWAMNAKYAIDANINAFVTDEALERIKMMFWANKSRDVFKNEKINVAVHIRRPNNHDRDVEEVRYTQDMFYIDAMNRIRREYSGQDLLFHIYSQGDIQKFDMYKADDVVFHIDQDVCSTFIEMVSSDVLVTAFSSLSYIAGYLTDGVVYYQNFWHPPRSKWILL